MGRALKRLALVALLAATPSGAVLTAQDRARQQLMPPRDTGNGRHEDLERAAAIVRKAWLAHDAATIVGGSGQVVMQLPGADPSAAVGARQAAALLSDFLGPSREVELMLRDAREVEPGRGYVEMVRRYRVEGTQDVRTQNLFLGYRRARQRWVLVELRAIAP